MPHRTTRVRRVIQPDGTIVEQPTGAPPCVSSCVASLMTSLVYCVREDARISAVTELLLERGFSAVPVVDRQGRPRGIVSKTDLLRHQHEERGDLRAADVMMPLAFVVDQTSPVGNAAALMTVEGVHRVLVTDASGAVVGILSSLDLVRWVGQLSGYAA